MFSQEIPFCLSEPELISVSCQERPPGLAKITREILISTPKPKSELVPIYTSQSNLFLSATQ